MGRLKGLAYRPLANWARAYGEHQSEIDTELSHAIAQVDARLREVAQTLHDHQQAHHAETLAALRRHLAASADERPPITWLPLTSLAINTDTSKTVPEPNSRLRLIEARLRQTARGVSPRDTAHLPAFVLDNLMRGDAGHLHRGYDLRRLPIEFVSLVGPTSSPN